jgi:Auxiliary Activity family 9 (formerly GH61)
MLFNFVFLLSSLLAFPPLAAAHGYISKVVIDGTPYIGNVPGAQPTDSPIRQIADINPVKGAQNSDINCGRAAQLATMVVPANPGSVVEFYWGDPNQENVSHHSRPFFFFTTSR